MNTLGRTRFTNIQITIRAVAVTRSLTLGPGSGVQTDEHETDTLANISFSSVFLPTVLAIHTLTNVA